MDLDKLRDEDKKNIHDLVTKLSGKGLRVELVGSAEKRDKNYRDIDLMVTGSAKSIEEAVSNLESKDFFPQYPIALVQKDEKEKISYMRTTLDCIVNLYSFGKTNLDLGFKVEIPKNDEAEKERFDSQFGYPNRQEILQPFGARNDSQIVDYLTQADLDLGLILYSRPRGNKSVNSTNDINPDSKENLSKEDKK